MESGLHYVILRNSQYAEAMISAYMSSDGVLANNMGEGKMAFISRRDCALAASYAAMFEIYDKILEINGDHLLKTSEFIDIGNRITGRNVTYRFLNDREQYAYFDSLGVPRNTEGEWKESAKHFPYCSDGMVTFGRAIRLTLNLHSVPAKVIIKMVRKSHLIKMFA